MATLATLLVKFGLQSSEFIQDLDKTEKTALGKASSIGQGLASLGGKALVGGVVAAGAAVVGLGAALGDAAGEAMAAQDVEAQLDAVLKSTGAAAAAQAAEYAAAAGQTVSATRLSAGALGELQQKLTDTQLKYGTLGSKIQEQKERIRQLTEQYGANGLATLTAKSRLAEMENEAAKLSGTMGELEGKIASGATVVTQNLADKLGLVPPVARASKEQVLGLASSLSEVTRFEDDAIVSGESLLLTFTNIGADIFPQATESMLDLSTAMDQDMQTSAVQLGKALNDPVAGVAALRKVGVQFTDSQQAMIEKMVATGDLAGAQAMILKELQTEFGGSARAAGQTAAGQFEILNNKLGNMKETVGTAVIPFLMTLGGVLLQTLGNPAVQGFIEALVAGLSGLATHAGNLLNLLVSGDLQGALTYAFGPEVAATIQRIYDNLLLFGGWLEGNWKPIVAGLVTIMLGFLVPAFITWAASAWAAATATIAALAPVLIPILAIAAVVGLLVAAWENNWGGMRDTLTAVWEGTLKPALETLWAWLQTNIPAALAALSGFWTGTLLPAIQAVWAFIQANVLPLLSQLWTWLATNVPAALQALAGFWTNTLLPALQAAWAWIETNLLPLFAALGTVLGAVVGKAAEALAGLWQNVLLPALKKAGEWIGTKLIPWLQSAADTVNDKLGPAAAWLTEEVLRPLAGTFETVADIIGEVVDWLIKLAQKIAEIELPEWLQPGSPTPFETGLVGINRALRELTGARLPALRVRLLALPETGPGLAYGMPAGFGVAATAEVRREGPGRDAGDTIVMNFNDQMAAALGLAEVRGRKKKRLDRGMG